MAEGRILDKCNNCGTSNDNKNPFCPKCGANLTIADSQSVTPSPQVIISKPIDPEEQAKKDLVKKKNLMFLLGFFVFIAIVGIAGIILISENYIASNQATNNCGEYKSTNSYDEAVKNVMDCAHTADKGRKIQPLDIKIIFQSIIVIGILGSIICGHQLYTLKK